MVAEKGHSILPITAFPIFLFPIWTFSIWISCYTLWFLIPRLLFFYTAISGSGKETHILMAVKRSVTIAQLGIGIMLLLIVDGTVSRQISWEMKWSRSNLSNSTNHDCWYTFLSFSICAISQYEPVVSDLIVELTVNENKCGIGTDGTVDKKCRRHY